VTLKAELGVTLKVIENHTIQSGTHDFLLTFYIVVIGLSRTVSAINSDFRRNRQFFPTPVYLTPPLKVSLFGVSAQGSEETRMMALREIKSYKTGLAVLIQYRRAMDTHPPSQPASHVAVTSRLHAMHICVAQ